jgi:hypothetical protein
VRNWFQFCLQMQLVPLRHGHWPKLLPTSAAQLLPRSPTVTLLRCVLVDPVPRVGAAATFPHVILQ